MVEGRRPRVRPSMPVVVERKRGDAWVKAAPVDDVIVASALRRARRTHFEAKRAVRRNARRHW